MTEEQRSGSRGRGLAGIAGARGFQPGVRGSRAWLPIIACAVVAAAGCSEKAFPKAPPAGSEMSRAIVDPYLKIEAALAEDSTEGVHSNAGMIVTAATSLGAPAMKIDGAALQLAAASEAVPPDIASVREKFGALSDAIDVYMTGLHLAPPEGVKVAFCPMVSKPWMQEGSTLANPYYGKEMPTCGSFR
jgi:membrane fusion protein, copper/silver efflux system